MMFAKANPEGPMFLAGDTSSRPRHGTLLMSEGEVNLTDVVQLGWSSSHLCAQLIVIGMKCMMMMASNELNN